MTAVAWERYTAESDPPTGREYWLVLDGGYVVVGERCYDKPRNIFRTDDLGGCDDMVKYYAPFVRPSPPVSL